MGQLRARPGSAGRLTWRWSRYNSARTFSYFATLPVTPQQPADNPGYARTPTSQTLFFGDRGDSFAGFGLMDLASTWTVPVWRSVRRG